MVRFILFKCLDFTMEFSLDFEYFLRIIKFLPACFLICPSAVGASVSAVPYSGG